MSRVRNSPPKLGVGEAAEGGRGGRFKESAKRHLIGKGALRGRL